MKYLTIFIGLTLLGVFAIALTLTHIPALWADIGIAAIVATVAFVVAIAMGIVR